MELKNVLILDFDDTIYPNPTNNFSMNINSDDLLRTHSFLNHQYDFTYLITGRYNQKEYLKTLLTSVGYQVDTIIDNPIDLSRYQEKIAKILYRTWKVNVIFQIITRNAFELITIYDDKAEILNALKIFDNVRLFLAFVFDKNNYEMIRLK